LSCAAAVVAQDAVPKAPKAGLASVAAVARISERRVNFMEKTILAKG
jgi:hypothetical protein